MRHRHRRLVSLGAALLLSLSVVGSSSAAPTITVLKSGLNNPRGIDVAANGQLLVAETGAGRVLSRDKKGKWRTVLGGLPVLPGAETSGVHAVAATGNGNALALIGEGPDTPDEDARFGTLVRVRPAGRQVADIGAHQVADPDPTDLDVPAFPTQSNAYGLALVGGGRALVTDAGGNDLLLVHPNGTGRDGRPVRPDHADDQPPAAVPSGSRRTSRSRARPCRPAWPWAPTATGTSGSSPASRSSQAPRASGGSTRRPAA